MAADALQRRIAMGITLDCDETGGSNFQTLAAVVDGWDHTGTKAAMSDCSILTDIWLRKGKGPTDPGEITFMVAYDPANGSTTARLGSMLAVTGFDLGANFRISYPAVGGANNAHTESFKAYVSGMGRTFKKPNLLVCPVTLTIDGDPGMPGGA